MLFSVLQSSSLLLLEQEQEEEQAPVESPYIGKARHTRNIISEDLKQHRGSTCDVDSGANTPGPQLYSFAQAQGTNNSLLAEEENMGFFRYYSIGR